MSRFNTPTPSRQRTVNFAGGEAFKESPELEIVSMLLTSFLNDSYYRSSADMLARLKELVERYPLFAAKAAVFARREFGMRSITHAVAGMIAEAPAAKGQTWTKDFYNAVINRPDDILEILAYIPSRKNITNPMRKGLGAALSRFDAYQLGKYKGAGKKLSLIDAVNLLHPPHTPAIASLVQGTLAPPQTWEVLLTQAGSDSVAKAEAWTSLLSEDRLGYFALLRNLHNIKEQAPEALDTALLKLIDPERIKKSLVLPFRFFTAIKTLGGRPGNTRILGALSTALDISVANVKALPGKSCVIIDRSGSMSNPVTSNNSINMAELACLFGFSYAKAADCDVMIFGDEAAYLSYNPQDTLASLTHWAANSINLGYVHYLPPRRQTTNSYNVGHGTNFHAALGLLNKPYDNLIFFSDMQGWIGYNVPTSSLNDYRTRHNCSPNVWSFDLAGYGTLQFPEEQIYAITGWSDRVFDLMEVLNQDRHALINHINNLDLNAYIGR